MAEDIQEEGSEEKKKGTDSQDDDDFGLPDLEFEELEELDLDFEDESEEPDEEVVSEVEESIIIDAEDETISNDADEIIDEVADPDQDASRVLEGEDEEEGGLDFSSSEDSESDFDKEDTESIFASDPDVTTDSDGDSLFGESDDLDGGSIFESDDIALKEEEPKEEFQAAEDAELPSGYKPYSDEGAKGGFAKIIIFGAIGITLIGLVFLFAHKQGGGDEKSHNEETKPIAKVDKPKAKVEEKSASKGEEETKVVKDKVAEPKSDSKKKPASSSTKTTTKKSTPAPKVVKKVSKPPSSAPAGEIVNVQNKTGRSYIIIGSFIDEDLANDFAKKLSNDGKGAKVIFPYGKSKRYRVSVADFDSYSDAASQMASYKSTYGEGAWALKY